MRRVERALRQMQRAAIAKCGYALVLIGCAAGAALAPATHHESPPPAHREWPVEWDGRPLRPLARSEVEARFAAQFPGAIVRMTDGRQQLVLREVDRPTRLLHPAADCFRGLGYRVEPAKLEVDARARRWSCFAATRRGERLRVCERLVDAEGMAFTDVSAWYWSALTGRSQGPWQAVTTARAW